MILLSRVPITKSCGFPTMLIDYRVPMADVSNLKIAAEWGEPTTQKEQDLSEARTYSGKSQMIARDITSEFMAAASGVCNLQQSGDKKSAVDASQI